MFRETVFCLLLSVFLFTVAEAQQETKIPRIGHLSSVDPARESARSDTIRLALRELGYMERQNIAIEYRYAEGKRERLPQLATELVRLKVDIILVAGADTVVRAAKNATQTIPIVMTGGGLYPVAAGFVESLCRHPRAAITGLATLTPDLAGKRLELLKKIVPKLSRVIVLGSSAEPGNALALKETERPADAFKVQIQYLDILDPNDIASAFETAGRDRTDAVSADGLNVCVPAQADCRVGHKEPVGQGILQA